ncbi:MAG TPA: hypothetical protein VFZ42_09095 [Chitinophagaceae bacterium]
MPPSSSRWKKLFLFCLGLAIGTAFCMKWIESSFYSNNELFTIIGLELFYTEEKLVSVLKGMDAHVKSLLRSHLHFDFAFMAGIFPAIAAACMMAREKIGHAGGRRLLFILAALQTVAWGFDILENCQLLTWIDKPDIGERLSMFHFIVASKWIIALAGAIAAILVLLSKRRPKIPGKIEIKSLF